MSKALLHSVTELFRPQLPTWACEFTSRDFILTGVDSKRTKIVGRTAVDLAPGVITGSLSDKNFNDPEAMLAVIRSALSQVGFKGSEIGVVIPDDASRVAFLTAESLPSGQQERETFIRWKLKKSMPFDVDAAQVAFKVIGPHNGSAAGRDVVVALSPRAVIDEYVELMARVDLHAGFVIPSTVATLNLLRPSAEDILFVKVAPGSITTSVFRNERLRFYRRVPEMPIYDAVYPTIMYYQDKLMGGGIQRIVVCAYEDNGRGVITELQEKFGVPVHQLEPQSIDDMYKPALGAIGLITQ